MIVSYYNNARDTIPKDINLFDWLYWTINPPPMYDELVKKFRDTYDEDIKTGLPSISMHARFHTHRSEANISHPSGFIVIDVDRYSKAKNKAKRKPQNPCVDMQLVKEFFAMHPACIYAGFSVGGDGVYGVFKINPNRPLIDYFNHFQKSLIFHGINIDSSCKDYARLRFFSVDRDAYFNKDAIQLEIPKVVENTSQSAQPIPQQPRKTSDEYKALYFEYEKCKKIVDTCVNQRIDITCDYDDWVKIGAALAAEFGEDGRALFHALSSTNSEYDYSKCDRKYNSCARMNRVSIGTLYNIAKNYGVTYKN